MKDKWLIFLIILSIVPLINLFNPGLPITHDGQDHVARIANFYQSLSEGNIIPRWAGNLNWGYGHPILMFLYPLPSYIASLFNFLGFSLIDSVKIVFGLGFILSGVFMYLFLREFLEEHAAFLGGLLYLFAPYRFVDIYVRGALGEHVAFVFLPLILYFLLKISKEESIKPITIIGAALSFCGLFLSHNAVTLMFLPIAFLYSIFLVSISKNRNKLLQNFVWVLVLGIGLSSFFLLPAYFEGKYTLRDIVTAKDYATRFTDIGKFLYGNWNYGISGQFSVQIGIVQWLLILLALPLAFFLHKRKSKLFTLTVSSIIIFAGTIFLMVPESRFIWDKITVLQKFQFPWRFLTIAVFISSFLGAIVINQIQKKKELIIVILIILILFFSKDMWRAKGYLIKDESFFTDIYNSTTDTGESSPIWSVRFMEFRPNSHVEVISGDAKIKELKRNSTKHEYKINVVKNARIRENTLYFPGWKVLVDAKPTSIEFQDPQNRGVMTFNVTPGDHQVLVQFEETKLRMISDLISIFSLLTVLFLWKSKQFRSF